MVQRFGTPLSGIGPESDQGVVQAGLADLELAGFPYLGTRPVPTRKEQVAAGDQHGEDGDEPQQVPDDPDSDDPTDIHV